MVWLIWDPHGCWWLDVVRPETPKNHSGSCFPVPQCLFGALRCGAKAGAGTATWTTYAAGHGRTMRARVRGLGALDACQSRHVGWQRFLGI